MSDTPKHSVSVAGIVVDDDGRILVIRRRDNGRWEPPGGVLELGESFEAGVYREVIEETGVPVAVDRLTGVYKNVTRGIVALVFRCTPLADSARPTNEASCVRWIHPNDVIALMDEAYAIRVTDAISGNLIATRSHDGVHLLPA